MLTDDILKKLAEIRHRSSHGNPQDPADPADRAFLLDLIDLLSREKPDDFNFPPYAALVNDDRKCGYAMRLDRRVQREQVFQLSGNGSAALLPQDGFRQEVSCEVTDAEMLVRPYVRLIEPREDRIIERLSSGTLSLLVDDYVVLDRFPIRDFLAALDGYGVRRRPFSLTGFLSLTGPLFRACGLVPPTTGPGTSGPGHEVAMAATFPIVSNEWNADGGREYGLMLPRQSVIGIKLGSLGQIQEPCTLALGVVSALYSTKSKIIRKQDWSPRDSGVPT